MRQWKIIKRFSFTIVREVPADKPPVKSKSKLEWVGLCAFYLGMAILAYGAWYEIHTFRISPKELDATHTVFIESHGDQRYRTQAQVDLCGRLFITGAITCAIGAVLLCVDYKFGKRTAALPRPET